MSDLIYAVMELLRADAGIIALVSTRVYRARMPLDPTFPLITISGIAGQPWILNSSGTKPLEATVIQISCWADLESTTKTIARTAAELLHGYAGTASGIPIGSIQVTNSPDGNTIYSPDVGLYMTPLDIMVRYT